MQAAPAFAQDPSTPSPSDADATNLEEVKGKLEAVTEQIQTLQADTDKLKKFKFSGYLQARWETSENSTDSVRVTGSPAELTMANGGRLLIRRGRLKLT